MANSNVVRVLLDPAVSDFVSQDADTLEAYLILNRAVDIQEQEHREMTLPEALIAIGKVSQWVEAIG